MLGLGGTLSAQREPKRQRLSFGGCSRRLHRVPKPGDRCASLLHTRFSVTLVRDGGTWHITASPDMVAALHVGVNPNYCICNSVNQAIVRFVVNTFPLFVLTCLFFALGWDLCPSLCFRQIIPCLPQDSARPSGKSVGVVPLRRISQGAPPFLGPLPVLELVASCSGSGNLAHLRFFDPGHFRASNTRNKLSLWQDLLEKSPCSKVELKKVIRNGVRVFRLFKPFRENFKGQAYSS